MITMTIHEARKVIANRTTCINGKVPVAAVILPGDKAALLFRMPSERYEPMPTIVDMVRVYGRFDPEDTE